MIIGTDRLWRRQILKEVRPLGLWRLYTIGTCLWHVTNRYLRGVRGLS